MKIMLLAVMTLCSFLLYGESKNIKVSTNEIRKICSQVCLCATKSCAHIKSKEFYRLYGSMSAKQFSNTKDDVLKAMFCLMEHGANFQSFTKSYKKLEKNGSLIIDLMHLIRKRACACRNKKCAKNVIYSYRIFFYNLMGLQRTSKIEGHAIGLAAGNIIICLKKHGLKFAELAKIYTNSPSIKTFLQLQKWACKKNSKKKQQELYSKYKKIILLMKKIPLDRGDKKIYTFAKERIKKCLGK